MAKSLNFNTVKKQYLAVTLADEKETKILIGTPTKKLLDEIIALESSIADYENESPEVIDNLYKVTAKIMSCNKTRKRIEKEYLEEVFDIEDIILLFKTYVEFIAELVNSKN